MDILAAVIFSIHANTDIFNALIVVVNVCCREYLWMLVRVKISNRKSYLVSHEGVHIQDTRLFIIHSQTL